MNEKALAQWGAAAPKTNTNNFTRRSVLTINFSTLYPYLQNVVSLGTMSSRDDFFFQHRRQLVKKMSTSKHQSPIIVNTGFKQHTFYPLPTADE